MAPHAPPEEMLVDYAAGNLAEPLALLVATHASLNRESRREVQLLESVGGAMLETLPPAEMSDGALDSVLAQMDDTDAGGDGDGASSSMVGEAAPPSGGSAPTQVQNDGVPAPLRPYVGSDLHALPWRERGGSVAEYRFLDGRNGYRTRLMRIRAGCKVPSHTHRGCEYTLVIEGGFSDTQGDYFPGDVAVADADVTHQPVAWPDRDCICLTVLDAPVRMTGPMGRILNLFVDF
ncbi:anti-ECFsigma factor, ChrR [Limimonas halophila]|uniref:Anti-ECFsigma factor, ChrR n=1 Tax=Limimonas halophila TaxID=1082479 RepID=A0A1G7NZQ0_9PROT|nr:ChrR family anti-sigma-E factor [Limimonas halophila]SDF78839.1 anti-ECFsigma factor, ChrR [Limimonas halophila]